MLDIILLAVAADDVPLLIDVLEQLVARVKARVASTACRLLPTVDLPSTSTLRVDHVLFGVFVLGEDVVDARSELFVGLFLLLDAWDLEGSAALKAHLCNHDFCMPGVRLPSDSGLLPPDHTVEDSRFQLLPWVRADDHLAASCCP